MSSLEIPNGHSNGHHNSNTNGAASHGTYPDGNFHHQKPTFPLSRSVRQKARRWPLAFRFTKGAIHHVIIVPVLCHAIFTTAVVYIDQVHGIQMRVPSTIVPSLSIVVGLMLVFRNSTSYDRFWVGRCNLQSVVTCVRNLARSFLVCGPNESDYDKAEKEKVIRVLVGMLYALKNHLRREWALGGSSYPEYVGLLPPGMRGKEEEGVGLLPQLAYIVERYIRRGAAKGAFNAPQSAMLSGQLNTLLDNYGHMETIKLTPIPVCHQIHQKQVMALYCTILPFCLVDDMGWLAVPIIFLLCFTIYGIEGIGEELEDPFGSEKNDIKMDAIISDAKQEIMVLLDSWKRDGEEYRV